MKTFLWRFILILVVLSFANVFFISQSVEQEQCAAVYDPTLVRGHRFYNPPYDNGGAQSVDLDVGCKVGGWPVYYIAETSSFASGYLWGVERKIFFLPFLVNILWVVVVSAGLTLLWNRLAATAGWKKSTPVPPVA